MKRTFSELREDVQQAKRDLESHLQFDCDSPEDCPEVKLFMHALRDARAALAYERGNRKWPDT